MIKKCFILVDRLYWLWLILAAPFLMFPSEKRSLMMLVIPATWGLHWFLVRADNRDAKRGSGAAAQVQKTGFSVTPLNLALLCLALMVLVSIWTTYDLMFSFGKITGIVLGFWVYFTVLRLCNHARGFWISLGVFVFSGLVIASLGLLGTDWTQLTKVPVLFSISTHLPGVIRGLQGAESGFNPNEVAGSLVWILPLTLVFLVVSVVRFKRLAAVLGKGRVISSGFFCLAVSLFLLTVLVLTQSRGAYIGFTLSILLLIFCALPKKGRWFIFVGFSTLLILAGVLLATHWREVWGWFSGGILAQNPTLSFISLNERLVIWTGAIKGIQDFPFTGMGLNTFRKLMNVLYPYSGSGSSFWLDIGHAHNEFLQAGVDLGIPGLIAFMALYIGAFWMLIKTWRATFYLEKSGPERNPEKSERQEAGFLTNGTVTRSIVLGLAGGLLAHLLYGLADAVALGAKPGFLFWMLLALISGLFSLIQKSGVQAAHTGSLSSTEEQS